MIFSNKIQSVVFRKRIVALLVCGAAAFNVFAADKPEPTQEEIRIQNQYIEYRLMQGEIYKIYVKKNDGVTTIQFPAKISEIAGKNISADGKGTDFQIAVQPGKNYFSVTAQSDGATGTLSVTYNRQIYILYLIQSDREAYASVVFGTGGGARNYTNNVISKTPKVTPARLVSLIDIAKKYEILKETYPDTLAGVEQAKFKNRYRCGKYDIFLDEAIRFEQEDTIIFKLRLANLTGEEIKYDKHSFSAHAGDGVYYMSVSDAAGFIPPRSEVYAWFGITSTPRGGRNNLRADNDWLIALTTQEMHTENIQSVQDELKEKERLEAEARTRKEQQEKEAGEKIEMAQLLMTELEMQRKTLDETKAEIQKSFAELQKKLYADQAVAEAARKEAEALLQQARIYEQEVKEKSAGLEKEIQEKKQKNASPENSGTVEESRQKTVSAIRSMRNQTQEAIRQMQEKTSEAVTKMTVPAQAPETQEE